MSISQKNFQELLSSELITLFGPIAEAGSSSTSCLSFLDAMGWEIGYFDSAVLSEITTAINSIASSIQSLQNILVSPPQSISEVRDMLDGFKQLFDSINALSNVSTSFPQLGLANFGKETFETILWGYLINKSPILCYLLSIFGVVRNPGEIPSTDTILDNDGVTVRRSINMPGFDLNNLKRLVNDLNGFLLEEYQLPSSGNILTSQDARIVSQKLFPKVNRLLRSIGLNSNYKFKPLIDIDAGIAGTEIAKDSLSILLEQDGMFLLSLVFMLSPADRGDLGLAIALNGEINIDELFKGYRVTFKAPVSLAGFAIGPHGFTFPDQYPLPEISATLSIRKEVNADNIAYLIGSSTESRLEIGSFEAGGELIVAADRKIYGCFVNLEKCKLVLHPSNGDGFLAKILPDDGIEADFDLKIKWDNVSGLSFSGSGSLEVEIPVHKTILNTLTIDAARISIRANNSINLNLGIDAMLKLGPVEASVRDVGLKAVFSIPSSGNGNLGPVNVDFDFKTPTGVGIAISSPAVTGGGFLNFDQDTKTYTGALELSFTKFSLSAFGIISTQLPDGSDGYSLLIFITAQFQPIQIGMGFTLNGVGGMLGLHRSTNVEYLRAGLRDNTLNNILFPTDIVTNASAIISTANQAFPIQEGRFVFGPMAKIGWGTPNILTVDLGIIIEVPDPVRLVILGIMKSILPDASKETLKLQVNFLGIIDFDKKQLSFDASIFDSHLLTFTLSGDLALRISWGDTPNFLLSVGGFHPAYTPPPLNLPVLNRIAVQIFNEENLQVRFECYFALTSNSAQFGSRLEAYAAAGKYNATALLWFDLLFQFSPFHMLANMGVQVSIRKETKVLLGAYLDVSVEGPGPWRVWGEVTFTICKINCSIDFDKTFGEGAMEVNLPVAVLSKMTDALAANGNWTAQFPDRNSLLVALRDLQLPEGTLLAEPFGNLTFRQQVLPLNTTFRKFGNAPLADYQRFEIINVRDLTDNPLTAVAVTDFFASNEFYYLSDSEKLSKPSYELFKSGTSITGTGELQSSYFVHRVYQYEEIVIDMRQRSLPSIASVGPADFEAQLLGNAIAQSTLSPSQIAVPHNAPANTSITTQQFTLAHTDNLSLYGSSPIYFDSETQAELYLDSLIASNNSLQNQLIVINELELVA